MFEFLQRTREPGVSPSGKTLEDLLRALNEHQVTLPVGAAVELIVRLCALLPGEDPLGGLPPSDVRFTSEAKVLIAGEPQQGGPRRRRRPRRDFLGFAFAYLSPEQVMGRKLDERSEVFNLAVVLHECLTGRPLFTADTELGLLAVVRAATLPPRDERIPVELDLVLRRALSEDPGQRQQEVRELREALLPFRAAAELDEVLRRFAAIGPEPEPPPAPPLPPGDEQARLVYADWLEEDGQKDEASWLRMESGLCALKGDELHKALGELRVLSDKVGTKFMATVARPAVEGCPIRFGFKCPMKWEAMERTHKEEVRRCRGCEQEVHFVRTMDDAWAVAARGGCVAIDPTLVRPQAEPEPEPGSYVGRLSPSPFGRGSG